MNGMRLMPAKNGARLELSFISVFFLPVLRFMTLSATGGSASGSWYQARCPRPSAGGPTKSRGLIDRILPVLKFLSPILFWNGWYHAIQFPTTCGAICSAPPVAIFFTLPPIRRGGVVVFVSCSSSPLNKFEG